jgi:Zn-dependent metalloprotease
MQAHTCTSACRRNPLHCILPPYLLEKIIISAPGARTKSGNPLVQAALKTLSLNHTFDIARVGELEVNRAPRQLARLQRLGRARSALKAALGGNNKQRTIYTADNTSMLPGRAVQQEGGPLSNDVAVKEAYTYMGNTYDFYWEVFQRDSIDDNGLPLNGTVHYEQDYDNAYWDGSQMVYGDGDGTEFNRFTIDVDIIGHELTHGVTQHESGLIYFGETGALNESLSDVMGSLVKQYAGNQRVDQADWLIGADLIIKGPQTQQDIAIRSLKAPGTAYDDPVLGKDPQPSQMKDYVRGLQDNGGVHTNSGIPNHAFYLIATKIGGYAWQSAGAIWYQAMTTGVVDASGNIQQLSNTATFSDFAALTLAVAQTQFPALNSPEQQAVKEGWAEVGIYV